MIFSILTREDKELVHERSLEVLAETGVKIKSPKILKMMKEHGCDVDFDAQIVRFTAKFIEDALEIAPKKFVLGALDEDKDLYLGENNSYICTDGQGCFVGDIKTGKRRESGIEDLRNAAKVADALDYIRCFWPIITANDVPDNTRTIHEMIESWDVCSLHFETDCYNEEQAACFKEVLRFLFPEEQLSARPPLSFVCCPVTPLIFEGPMLEGTVSMGEINAPAVILPMPISGTTAPMSLFSTIIQNNIEVLAGNAVLQTANPGRKVIYGAAPGILDMRTTLFCVGSVEGSLQNAACAEMGKFYGFPTMACFGSDAPMPGEQSGAERGVTGVPIYLSGADMICGVGLTGSAQILYLEEMVLCEDICNMCKRVSQGVRTGEEHSLTDLMKKIGPGGNFLGERSTLKYLKNGEHMSLNSFSRDCFETWELGGRKDCLEIASEKVDKILRNAAKTNFSREQREGLARIMSKFDKK